MKSLMVTFLTVFLASQSVLAQPTHRIFISNEKGNSVTVINGTSNQVEATIEVGKRPRGIGLAPDGSELYVAISGENHIAVFDPRSLKPLRTFASGDDPETFAIHPNGNIYISNEDGAKCSVYNPHTGALVAEIPVGLEPEGVAISPDGKQVIVTSESTNMLHVIGVPSHQVIANILVGSRPRAATFNHDGSLAYASAEIGGEVKKVDMASHKILKKARLGDEAKPKDVLLSKDEKTLYVAGGRANAVMVLDAGSLEILKQIPVGKRVWGLAMTRDGKRIYSTNGASSDVSVIDTGSNTVIATVKVGAFPWGVAIDD